MLGAVGRESFYGSLSHQLGEETNLLRSRSINIMQKEKKDIFEEKGHSL